MQQLATFMLGIEGPPYVTLISIIQLIHTSNILLDDVITVKSQKHRDLYYNSNLNIT